MTEQASMGGVPLPPSAQMMGWRLLATLAGAAGIYAFEDRGDMPTYADALWWTAMLMTTMGSELWPQTGEGRVLCLALSLYAFAVFGYTTATIATFFVGRDADDSKAAIAGASDLRAIRAELQALRRELNAIAQQKDRTVPSKMDEPYSGQIDDRVAP